MIRKLSAIFAFVFMTLSLVGPSASAAVSYFPGTGGYVGKGDVQTAIGLNNSGLQNAVAGITFEYIATATYSQVCSKEVQIGGPNNRETKVISNTFKDNFAVNATVSYETKKQNQVAGFNLSPISLTSSAIPTDLCPNENSEFAALDAEGNPTQPILVESSGGLFMVYEGVYYALPNTPVIN